MKKSDVNIEQLFEKACFEVQDEGFSERVMKTLPSIYNVDRRALWRVVFTKVASVVAIVAVLCVVVGRNLDFGTIGTKIVDKTQTISCEIAQKISSQMRLGR